MSVTETANMPLVVVTEPRPLVAQAQSLLTSRVRLIHADLSSASDGELVAADVLWVRLGHYIGEGVLSRSPRLRVIVSPTTGLSHLDERAAANRGVVVLSLRGESEFLKSVRATAELTLALILTLLRNIVGAVAHTRHLGWDRDRFEGREVYGKVVGVIGYGRLGGLVADYLRAMGATVLAYDPWVSDGDGTAVEFVTLCSLLERSDIVTVHADLNDHSRRLIGERELEMMRPGAILVNTARGEIIDEEALVVAIRRGRIGGVALDVLSGGDPATKAQSELLAISGLHSNVIVTPHIGGCTSESISATQVFMARRLLDFLEQT